MMGDVVERNVGDALTFKAASRVIERACLWVRPARRPGLFAVPGTDTYPIDERSPASRRHQNPN